MSATAPYQFTKLDMFSELVAQDDLTFTSPLYLVEFRKYCATDPSSQEFIDRVDQGALNRFSLALIEQALKVIDDVEDYEETVTRKSRVVLTTFMNAALRSSRFRATVSSHSILHWLTLLRVEVLRNEVLQSILSVIRELHKAFFLDDGYMHLLGDLAILWNQSRLPSDHRSTISATFAILLEEDYGFLSECRQSMEREAFTDLLYILETLVDKSAHQVDLPIHPNNMRFCVDLLERVDWELSNDSAPVLDSALRLRMLVDIIASGALKRPNYDDSLHAEQRAIRLVCGLLTAHLDVDATELSDRQSNTSNSSIQSDADASTSENTIDQDAEDDCPTRPKQARRQMEPVLRCHERLRKLVEERHISANMASEMRQACVRAIGNLVHDSPQNQVAAGQLDAIYVSLCCGAKHDNDRPFITQWAIATVHQLCLKCPQNQERLLNLPERNSAGIDKDRLLATLGWKAVPDETSGRLKLIRTDPSSPPAAAMVAPIPPSIPTAVVSPISNTEPAESAAGTENIAEEQEAPVNDENAVTQQ
ncbi:hypothetical protein AAVH_20428 [Aphelenchoides avenae]|nr:hypothetical protein AAVH_20428 [Aphelenchus avenae]